MIFHSDSNPGNSPGDSEDHHNPILPKTITQRVFKGLFWTFTGTGAEFVLQAGTLLLLARLISPEEFGVVGAALVVVNFSSIFSQLGIEAALVQHPNLETRHVRTGFTVSLFFGLVLTVLVILVAPVVAAFFHMQQLINILYVLSSVFLLQGISVAAESLLKRQLSFRLLASIEVASFAIGYGVVGVVLALLKYGSWALVGATLIQALIKSILLLLFQRHRKGFFLNKQTLKELFYFGSGLTMGRVFLYFAIQGDNMVIGRWLGAETLGIYGRAYQLMVLPASLFGRAVDKVLFPALAKVQDSSQHLAVAFKRGMALTALFVLPANAVMFIMAPEIIYVLLGPAWQEVIIPFRILAVGMFFRTGYKVTNTLAKAKGAVYHLAWRHGLYGAMVLVGSWFAYPYGISGVAMAVVGALVIYFFLMTGLSLRITGVSWMELLKSQMPAFYSTFMIILLTWLLVYLFRGCNFPAISILGIVSTANCLFLVVFYRFFPKKIVGEDGVWFAKTVLHTLNSRFGNHEHKKME